MKTKSILIIIISLIVFSCKKDPVNSVVNADFTVNKNTVYMYEPVNIKVLDSTGSINYNYDFGDGNVFVGGYNASHIYLKGGTYKITISIYGKTTTKQIRVYPGILSYQIKNTSRKELNILSYLNNASSGIVIRNDYRSGTLSDTLYSTSTFSPGTTHILGFSLFSRNTEYIPYHVTFIEALKHSILEIKDSTEMILPYGNVTPQSIRYVTDL